MELKGQQGSLGYNNNLIFRETSETLDPRHHHLQQNSLTTTTRRPNQDQFNGSGGERVAHKSSGSSLISGVRFRECQKNHAAGVGGNVLDGCGEFMPSGDDGTMEALKCAACNCHRNFHRREPDHGSEFALHLPPLPSPSLRHHQRLWTPIVSPVKITFGGGGGTDSSSEDLNFNTVQSNAVAAGGAPPPPPFVLSKKRFRTKFTQEQKDKMLDYAEKVGWRIPREDAADVQRFCAEVGVKRRVLKVWMHNNKISSTKKQPHEEGES